MNRDQEELLLRLRELERTPLITNKMGAMRSQRWAYQVTIRKVWTSKHVILAAGTRTVIGSAAESDPEQDLGAYTEGASVYIVRTYPTFTEGGAWGSWKCDSEMPQESEQIAVYHIATLTGGLPVHGHMGNIRHMDVRRYRTCADTA